jgi:hypothetical protein
VKADTFPLYAFVPGGGLDGGINEGWATGSRDGCNALLVVTKAISMYAFCVMSVDKVHIGKVQ